MSRNTERDALDSEIITAVLRGERDRYAQLVRRYEQVVYRLSYSYLGSREEAADAAQEVFLKAFRSLSTFRVDRRFLPWLYSITLNYLRSRHRATSRIARSEMHVEIDSLPEMRETDDPSRQAIDAERRTLVRDGVARLPIGLREPVVLYYFEGLSVEECAEALGLHEENVKARLFRARKKLKTLFADDL